MRQCRRPEMLVSNLCSRPELTSTRDAPESRAGGLRRTDRSLTPRARIARTLVRAPTTKRSTSTPTVRCRSSEPQVVTRLDVASTSCKRNHPPREGVPRTVPRQRPAPACSARCTPGGSPADIPCHAAPRGSREIRLDRSRGPLLSRRANAAWLEARNVFHRRIPRRSTELAPDFAAGTATAAPAWPPRRSFQRVFTLTQ